MNKDPEILEIFVCETFEVNPPEVEHIYLSVVTPYYKKEEFSYTAPSLVSNPANGPNPSSLFLSCLFSHAT